MARFQLLVTQLCMSVVVLTTLRAAADTRNWVDGTGNWSVTSNWSQPSGTSTTPLLNEPVNIAFADGVARTITLNTSTPQLGLFSLDLTGAGATASTLSITSNFSLSAAGIIIAGYNGSAATNGRGAVVQQAGTVSTKAGWDFVLGNSGGSIGTYTLNGTGQLTALQSEYIGYAGSGTVNQSAGINTIMDSSVGSMDIGILPSGNGTYNLSGSGTLNVDAQVYVGDQGTGSFIQTGGTHTISGTKTGDGTPNDLNLAYSSTGIGTYTLSGGTATVPGDVHVGGSAVGQGGLGTLNISGTGSMTIADELHIFHNLNSAVNLSGGTLHVKALNFTPADFNWTGGTLNITTSAIFANSGSSTTGAFGNARSLGTGQTLQLTGNETLGNSIGAFTLTVNSGGTNTVSGTLALSRTGVIFQNSGSTITSNAETVGDDPVSGSTHQQNGGTNTIATSLQVGTTAAGANGTYTLATGGILSAASEQIGVLGNGTFSQNGGTNTVTNDLTVGVSGTGTSSFTVSSLGVTNVGGNVLVGQSTGPSALTIDSGTLNVTGTLQIANKSTASLNVIDGGTINTGALNLNGAPSHFNWTWGTLNITTNATWDPFAGSTATGSAFGGQLTLVNGKHLKVTGNETLASNFFLDLETGGQHTVTSTLTIASNGKLKIDGGTLDVGSITNNGTFDFQSGLLAIRQTSANLGFPIVTGNNTIINIAANNIALGSASSFAGFSHQGTLFVNNFTATLNSAGYAKLGLLTTMTGGTLNAPNGITLASGSNLQGSGAVNARVAGELGAVIEASGGLSLGDTASPAGFNFNGELRTKQFAVTLNSAAPAGLGNLTTLGNGASSGTLNATNGFVVDFDEAVTGYGTISSNNTLAKHATINGTVQGTSAGQPITFSGYIKGTGTFTNATFTGTYSPGLSPTSVSAGNLAFGSTNTLIMELAGTGAGNQYDQTLATGSLALGGTLDIELINGFIPAAGNSFNLFDWGSISGTFATLSLPTLTSGLTWNTSQLYATGIISVAAAGIPGDYNNNGTVDAGDYILWRKYNNTSTTLPNDATLGTSPADYTVWRSRFGQPPGSGSGTNANAVVPEPATFLLMMFGVAGWCLRRRRTA